MVVNTDRDEVDYVEADGTTQTTRYSGNGGVSMGSFFRRAAFALRFGDINPLISNFITAQSKILYVRDVSERVRLLAPFLDFDSDPYPVVRRRAARLGHRRLHDHRRVSLRPAGRRPASSRRAAASGTRFNYVRNSVKAVVDAYDGTVTFYVVDPTDPLIQAYQKAFPKLFTDGSKMPDGAARAPPLPGGSVPGADQHVGPLPHHRTRPTSTARRCVERCAGSRAPWPAS